MKLQELLNELKELEFNTLVDLYLEAKTGKSVSAIDILPTEIVEQISELEDAIRDATGI